LLNALRSVNQAICINAHASYFSEQAYQHRQLHPARHTLLDALGIVHQSVRIGCH
jgi:hypothetical protein